MVIRKLAVLGSPISHSKSPAIHSAAYRVLGLDWAYDRFEIRKGGLSAFLDGLDDAWLGFSLTMPLKEEAARLAASLDRAAEVTGAVNTLLRLPNGWAGFNTDVFGIVQSLYLAGVAAPGRVLIVGSGATATSATAAVRQISPTATVEYFARNERTRESSIEFAKSLGLRAKATTNLQRSANRADLVISTLPAHAMDEPASALAKARGFKPSGVLFDVAYQPWPSQLAGTWQSSGCTVVSGLEMLLWQAVAQIRIFTSGDASAQLPNEAAVVEAMRYSL